MSDKSLLWLWTHCRAIGMTKKADASEIDSLAMDIALFTADQKGEIERLREREQRLQRALAFWHPGVRDDTDDEQAKRAGDDAMLLFGLEDADSQSAADLGWIAWVVPGEFSRLRDELHRTETSLALCERELAEARGLLQRIDECDAITIERDWPNAIVEEADAIYDDMHAFLMATHPTHADQPGVTVHICRSDCADGADHSWDGPLYVSESDGLQSATCSKCGMTAFHHSMMTGP